MSKVTLQSIGEDICRGLTDEWEPPRVIAKRIGRNVWGTSDYLQRLARSHAIDTKYVASHRRGISVESVYRRLQK